MAQKSVNDILRMFPVASEQGLPARLKLEPANFRRPFTDS
jgi:hypothetical protein